MLFDLHHNIIFSVNNFQCFPCCAQIVSPNVFLYARIRCLLSILYAQFTCCPSTFIRGEHFEIIIIRIRGIILGHSCLFALNYRSVEDWSTVGVDRREIQKKEQQFIFSYHCVTLQSADRSNYAFPFPEINQSICQFSRVANQKRTTSNTAIHIYI